MKSKEIVTLKNYTTLAMRTCLPSCKNKEYAIWGYNSEWHELQSKLYGYKAKKIRGDSEEKLSEIEKQIIDEIGDCFWFIALKCTLAKLNFEHIYKTKSKDLINLTNEELNIKSKIDSLREICKDWETAVLTCLRANIKKLSSRKERGVITGNGDYR